MPRLSPLALLHEAFIRSENERRAARVAESGRGDVDAAQRAAHHCELSWLPYGPEEGDPESMRAIVASFGPIEVEYAAIRRGAGLMDSFHRAALRVAGPARRDFLNRMLTQELLTLGAGMSRSSFWLNRKGRVDADLLAVESGDAVLLDLDWVAAAPTREALDRFLVAEDATIEDCSERLLRFSLHGPLAGAALEASGAQGAGALVDGASIVATIAGAGVNIARRDQCSVPGFELFVDSSAAPTVWSMLAEHARPIGWAAYNTARIEGGTPLFRVDFGVDSLPHETGVISSRVSFRKGCYLGQEIVARMESLGAPKQQVVAFKANADEPPIAGAQLRRPGEAMGTPVGVVTSSTVSPLLGTTIGFATVRSALADAGSRLVAHADGRAIELECLGPPRPFIDPTPEARDERADRDERAVRADRDERADRATASIAARPDDHAVRETST